jgi:predicted kinase/CRISPR/Cas system-associated endonuclease Cas3-HD
MSLRGKFIAWYNNEFKTDDLYKTMEKTVEGSPWHREKSVGTHTDMVVSEYISWADKEWTTETLIGAVACAFHDTGKPAARVEKYKPERGTYNSFGGHEVISARLWEDYALRNIERMWELFEQREINIIFQVGFVIEHHMPYEVPTDKIQNIATTAAMYFSSPVFQNHLTADTHGRVADDHKNKIAKVDEWIVEFEKKMHVPVHLDGEIRKEKTLILAIGPSGCGKSTLLKKLLKEHELHHYSWDLLRLEWYDSNYEKAYQMSVDDPSFNAKYMKEFKTHVLTGKNIYIDNTNLSRKRRRPFIDDARKHGYNVIGYVFPIALETLFKRQKARGAQGEKDVPKDAVRQHYTALQGPLLGEFDRIEVINTLTR